MLCVEYECKVKYACLKLGVMIVRAEHIQQILRNGEIRIGVVDKETSSEF